MKKILFAALLVSLNAVATAQIQTVQFNPKQLQFDNGKSLPAEKSFLISTDITGSVKLVKMQLSNKSFDRGKVQFESTWSRRDDDKGTVAILSNNYKLKSGNEYNFRFLYFRRIEDSERGNIASMLEKSMQAFLKSNIQFKENRYNFISSPKDLYLSLNSILKDGMVNYDVIQGGSTPKISGIVENMLVNLAKEKVQSDSVDMNHINRFETLLEQMSNEISIIVNYYEYVLKDELTILDYPTEKTMNTLSLNLGYAGIYKSGDVSNLSYYSGPYLGVSFPLGNRIYNSNFISNTSISAGVFLKNFDTPALDKVSGPLAGLPLYVGAGYRVFKFLRLQAGATLLEETDHITKDKSVYVKPFVGISIEFQMWLGLNSK